MSFGFLEIYMISVVDKVQEVINKSDHSSSDIYQKIWKNCNYVSGFNW